MDNLRKGWFRPDKHYIEHESHKARITRAGLKGTIKYQVFIKLIDDWHMPHEKPFFDLDDAIDAAETQLGLYQ